MVTSRWFFEPGHTSAELCARHMMITYVRGQLKNVHGFLEVDPEKPEAARVEARIDARHVYTGQSQRDAHLRSADFFDVEHHPCWNDVVDRGGVVVSDMVDVTVDVEAVMETPVPAA